MIAQVLAGAGASRADLTAVAVGVGPGPYTGLRVGVVTARVLGAVLGIPVHGVCSLDVIAADVPRGREFLVATDACDLALQYLQVPPKHSPASRATVQVLSGFGNQAFSALQVFHVGGAVTDVATVMVRYHNVVVTVTLNGLEHSNKGTYGPVSEAQLAAAAMAFARAAEGSLH